MRICIYGAGAIGCFLGAHLARVPGVQLTMLARGEALAAFRARGVRLETRQGTTEVSVAATDEPTSLPSQDVVFVALTAHQLVGTVLDGIAALLGPETAVVPPTTGIPYWYFHGLPSLLLYRAPHWCLFGMRG